METMRQLKRCVKAHLGDYRRKKNLLMDIDAGGTGSRVSRLSGKRTPIPSAEEVRLMRQWTAAIEQARTIIRRTSHEKERIMTRYFGLDTPVNRSGTPAARLIRLAAEYNVASSTLYVWLDEIYGVVQLCAVATGALTVQNDRISDE